MPKTVKIYLDRHTERFSMLAKNKQNEKKKKTQKSAQYFIDGPSMTADIIIIVHNDSLNCVIH